MSVGMSKVFVLPWHIFEMPWQGRIESAAFKTYRNVDLRIAFKTKSTW